MRVKILLIYTGGTIGMAKNPETGALIPLDFDHLSKAFPELQFLDCEVHTISFSEPIDSSSMHPNHWVEMAHMVRNNYDLYDGFVILHGSDTMAFSASALSFMLEDLGKPVIFTGSQLPVGVLRTDARENLISSIELAAMRDEQGRAKIPEVAIYFEYKLYRGNRTYKNSSQNFEAFQSPNYPDLAKLGVEMLVNSSAIMPHTNMPLKLHTTLNNNIAVIPLFPGINQNIIYKTAEAGTQGLILRTFGAGNGPADVYFMEALQHCIQAGIPVINVSQCRIGAVNQTKYAAGRQLQDIGVISGRDSTLEAAIAKLMYLLGLNMSDVEIAHQFSKSLRGEITV